MTDPSPSHRVRRELAFFGLAFGLPFVALVLLSVLTVPSPLPLWRRLVTLEDTCPYFVCIVIPLLVYAVARIWRAAGGPEA